MIPAQKVAQKGELWLFYSSFFQYMLVIHQNGSHPQFIMPGIDVGITYQIICCGTCPFIVKSF